MFALCGSCGFYGLLHLDMKRSWFFENTLKLFQTLRNCGYFLSSRVAYQGNSIVTRSQKRKINDALGRTHLFCSLCGWGAVVLVGVPLAPSAGPGSPKGNGEGSRGPASSSSLHPSDDSEAFMTYCGSL